LVSGQAQQALHLGLTAGSAVLASDGAGATGDWIEGVAADAVFPMVVVFDLVKIVEWKIDKNLSFLPTLRRNYRKIEISQIFLTLSASKDAKTSVAGPVLCSFHLCFFF
jgi:hypothetical protein